MAKRSKRRVVREELSGVDLGDRRRGARAMAVAERLASAPEATLPEAMGDRAMLEGLYRHLSSDGVTFEALLEQHLGRTARRCASEPAVYAIHDTTVCTFPGEAERTGLGRVNGAKQGFFAHVSLAVSADGRRVPLGLLRCELFTRDGDRSIEEGESKRWLRGIVGACQAVGDARKIIHVADRESDMYWLLASMVGAGQRFIVRASQDRLVDVAGEGVKTLFSAARETRQVYELNVPVTPRGKVGRTGAERKGFPERDGRVARLSFAALPVMLHRPARGASMLPTTVEVNVVHVFELGPPAGEKPIEWVLLTTEPVGTTAEIAAVVEGYRTRWIIEEFFKTFKTGCAFESRQLESFRSLTNLLAYSLIIAYAMLLMRALARTDTDIAADALLSDAQLLCLRLMTKRKVAQLKTARQVLDAIAQLGVHLRNNGDPGWRVLSRGWKKLLEFEAAYHTLQAAGLVINR
jgi:transposase-like protein/DDE family transposase